MLRSDAGRARLKWAGLLVGIAAIVLVAVAGYRYFTYRSFSSLAQFSAAWKQTPEAERHKLLPWLLGQSARRHTVYPVQRTRLAGLNRQQVEAVLGKGNLLQFGRERSLGVIESNDVLGYPIGSIERDIVGAMVPGISKADYLMIELDQAGNVVRVETSS